MDYDPIEQKMVPNPRGRLLLYREIDPTMEYTLGADVANGTGGEQEGAEGDWSVAQGLDRHKRQVGVWRGNERKRVVSGTSVSVRVDTGGRSIITKQTHNNHHNPKPNQHT